MDYKNNTLQEFTDILSAPTPAPGGGAAAALSASIGISLGGMVASLTSINDKYLDVREEMLELIKKTSALKEKFLKLIDADASAYEPLSKAYKMPKNTPAEIEKRDEAIQSSLVNACLTPMEIMETCCEAIELLNVLANKGSKMVLSDVGAGVMLMRSALNTASINIFINLRNMKDKEFEASLRKKTNEILNKYTKFADYIYDDVMFKIS